MRPDEIVTAVEADLARFAQGVPGARARVEVASDPWNVLELLTTGPLGRLIVVAWAGDTNESAFPQAPIIENTLEVYVGCNLGLVSDPGRALTRGDDERPGLLRFAWVVRQRVRALMLDPEQTSTCFEYRGTEPVELPTGMPLAAYKARFAISVSDDEPGAEPEWTEADQ